MAENFIWLALPNEESKTLLDLLCQLALSDAYHGDMPDDVLKSIIRRLERQINGVSN